MCWHVTIAEHTQKHKKVNFLFTAAEAAQLCNAVILPEMFMFGSKTQLFFFSFFFTRKLSFSKML